MTVEELQVLITANTNNLRKEIQNVQKQVTGMQKVANKTSTSMLKSFNFLKNGIIALGIGKLISSQMDDAISRLDALNNFPKVMSNLGISNEEAQASMQRLSDALVGIPTTLDSATMAVQRLTSANGNVKASTEMFLALNNAILAGGASSEIQSSALEQLSQAYAKGKPDMMEWRTAMMAMPAQLKQVAIAMGYASSNDLGEALRNGEVSMDEFMVKLTQLNQQGANGFQSLNDQARNATGGVGTSITNLKTAFTRGLADIMNAIGQSNIAGFFNGIASAINKVVPYINGFVKACVWAVSSIASLFGKSTKKDIDDTSSSLSNLGTNGATSSKGLDKTTESTKKLKKELNGLAGFDEMNVLKESSSSSDSETTNSATGGDLSGIDLSAFDNDLSSVSSKADEVAEHLKSIFGTVGETIRSIWNSQPIQSFVGAVTTYGQYLVSFWATLGTNLWLNLQTTWSNIELNVSTSLTNMSLLWTTFWTDLQVGIETWGQPIIDGVTGVFNSIWQDAISPAVTQMSKVWSDFTGILVELWNQYGKPLVDNIGEFVDTTIGLFQKIWDNVLEPIITPFLETLSWLWDEHLKGLIQNVGDFIGKLVNGALEIYNQFIAPIVSFLLDTLAPAWSYISSLITGVLGTIWAVVSDVFGGIFETLGGVVDFITGIFTGNWKKAWEGVKSIFKGIIDGIAGIFKAPINLIIDGINAFIGGLNKIKIPDWVPIVGGKGFHIDKIPKLAQGGVIDKPTIAMIGEAGKEAVIPLENNTSWINELAEQLNGKTTGGQPIQLVVKIGEDTILNKVIDGINKKSFEHNGEVFNI